MTQVEERLVEQRTRIREARFMLRSVADDVGLMVDPKIEPALRMMVRSIKDIEDTLDAQLTVRKARAKEGT